MKFIVAAAALFIGCASPAFADLTIKTTQEGKGLLVSGEHKSTTFIRGNKMRTDLVDGDKTVSTIFDIDAQKMFFFDSKKKEYDVWDVAALNGELSKSVDTSKMKASLTPNGQTKQIAGQTATGYTMEMSIPAAMGGGSELNMVVTVTGPMWIVKGAPGSDDYIRLYKAMAEKGFILTDPRAAKASPGQARAMTEVYNQVAAAGGIAYEIEQQIKMGAGGGGGGNPLGGLLARMSTMNMHTTVTGVETGTLSDEMFAPPAGYKANQKK